MQLLLLIHRVANRSKKIIAVRVSASAPSASAAGRWRWRWWWRRWWWRACSSWRWRWRRRWWCGGWSVVTGWCSRRCSLRRRQWLIRCCYCHLACFVFLTAQVVAGAGAGQHHIATASHVRSLGVGMCVLVGQGDHERVGERASEGSRGSRDAYSTYR